MTGWRLLWATIRGMRCEERRVPDPLNDPPGTPTVRCVLAKGHDRHPANGAGWAHEGPVGFGYRWWKA